VGEEKGRCQVLGGGGLHSWMTKGFKEERQVEDDTWDQKLT
jgi:hypothetical protein